MSKASTEKIFVVAIATSTFPQIKNIGSVLAGKTVHK